MMKNVLDKVDEILLMGPGPSCIHETVYDELSRKTLGHMDPYFIHIMDEIKRFLQTVMLPAVVF